MNVLVAFYSLEGNCRALSRVIHGSLENSVMLELRPVNFSIPRSGVFKYLVGGMAALLKEKPELQPFDDVFASADFVIVGSPVWFGRMSSPVRSFLENADWKGKKAAVFAMHRGGKGSAAADMAAIIAGKGGNAVSKVNFKDLRYGKAEDTLEEAAAWAKVVVEEAGK